MPETIELQATGELPLEFEGELLFEASSARTNGSDNNRWHEIEIYKDADESQPYPYVCQIAYRTQWQGESDYVDVYEEDSLDTIAALLQFYDPIEHLIGFPPGKHHEDKQIALILRLQRTYTGISTDILADMGVRRQRRQKEEDGDSRDVS